MQETRLGLEGRYLYIELPLGAGVLGRLHSASDSKHNLARNVEAFYNGEIVFLQVIKHVQHGSSRL